MKETYLGLLKTLLTVMDYRSVDLSMSHFDMRQMLLRLKNKKGPISKKEIAVIEGLCEEFKKGVSQ